MMLAPFALHALLVLVEEKLARRRKADHFRRSGDDLGRAASFSGYLIKLCHGALREEGALRRVLNRCREYHLFPVGSKGGRDFRSRVKGQPPGFPAFGRHDEHVHIAEPIAGESDLFPVGRPYRSRLIRTLGGQTHGFASRSLYLIYIAFITKSDFASVWRDDGIAHPERCHRRKRRATCS